MMNEGPQDIRQDNVGDYNATTIHGNASVTVNHLPVSSVLPKQVRMVPHRRNPFFTGRDELLTRLHDRFVEDRAAVLTQGQAIHGLGGIGKTQIAVEYAYRYQNEYRFVLWASAASEDTLRAAYVSMADRLQLPERILQEQEKIVAASEGRLECITDHDAQGRYSEVHTRKGMRNCKQPTRTWGFFVNEANKDYH